MTEYGFEILIDGYAPRLHSVEAESETQAKVKILESLKDILFEERIEINNLGRRI